MYVVVGGGVAGVCCVQELLHFINDSKISNGNHENGKSDEIEITFICGKTGFIKTTDQITKISEISESFTVKETQAKLFFNSNKIKIIQDDVISWNYEKKEIFLTNGDSVHFDKLCIATGARPIFNFVGPHIVTLRDMDTISDFQKRLSDARRIVLIGNGGIANELAYELKDVEIIWAIRHQTIAASYLDKQAATLFLPKLQQGRPENSVKAEVKIDKYTVENNNQFNPWTHGGCSLGPHWLAKLHQNEIKSTNQDRKVHLITEVELSDVRNHIQGDKTIPELPDNFLKDSDDNPWKCQVKLTNGNTIGADFVILAIGVTPNSEIWSKNCSELKLEDDYGIKVDNMMKTNLPNVYAVGDVCTLKNSGSPHWSQIRLWTQARVMGTCCARSMVYENDVESDIFFEIFTHVTTFYGYEVILLGDFAGQNLETPYNIHVRCDDDGYIKVLSKNNKIHGAVLVGETDLPETFENLILNQTDITSVETDLLNPFFDLEDYYD